QRDTEPEPRRAEPPLLRRARGELHRHARQDEDAGEDARDEQLRLRRPGGRPVLGAEAEVEEARDEAAEERGLGRDEAEHRPPAVRHRAALRGGVNAHAASGSVRCQTAMTRNAAPRNTAAET